MDLRQKLEFVYPGNTWYFEGDEIYTNLVWGEENSTPKPSESEIETAWLVTEHNIKLHNLRIIRNSIMKNTDWVVIKHYSQGLPVPDDWAAYLQALRDLPATQISNVVMNSELTDITNIDQIIPTNPDGVQFINGDML
jgi:hypothetical protein